MGTELSGGNKKSYSGIVKKHAYIVIPTEEGSIDLRRQRCHAPLHFALHDVGKKLVDLVSVPEIH